MNASDANVLNVGGGAREHAIGLKLHKDGVKNLFFCPGNAGTESIGTNVNLDPNDFEALLKFVKESDIHLIVVGPEDPLSKGIVDFFQIHHIPIIGPTVKAAQLETSKVFARNLMARHNIPQPEFFGCRTPHAAQCSQNVLGLPVVLKADGLAAGKGALVCKTEEEWEGAMKTMFIDKKFGAAGDKVLVEKCLEGEELSVFALCDGPDYRILGTAQDHKRLLDNDQGPNTGGMGAYSPTPLATPELMAKVEKSIIGPILQAMVDLGCPYQGFLYVGLMLTADGPMVIEFNARLGDPEAQVILPLIKSSFFNLLYNAAQGQLAQNGLIEFYDAYVVAVVKAAGGYPDKYEKGNVITGLDDPDLQTRIIHAGTKKNETGQIVTNGGRVVDVLGFGATLKEGINDVYRLVDKVHFKDEYFRQDIGQGGLRHKE